jgi:serine/threonine-protein kinase RsbW
VAGDERTEDGTSVLHRRMPAGAGEITELRQLLTTWAAGTPLTRTEREDLVLATYEAMANVIEHAYHDQATGSVDVRATHRPGVGVTVVVADRGRWRTPGEPGNRGRGLRIIRALASTEVEHGPDGTTVTMHWPAG